MSIWMSIKSCLRKDDRLDIFIKAFETSLYRRYHACEDFAATPSSILLAVTNAVAEAREEAKVKP